MESFLGMIHVGLALVIIAIVGFQAYWGTVPLPSARNFFLFGVLIFQVVSAALSFFSQNYWDAPPSDPVRSGITFTLGLVAFLGMLEVVYRTGWFSFGLARRLTTKLPIPSDGTIMWLAGTTIFASVVFRFVLTYIPVFGVLSSLMGMCLASAAAGLICWVTAKQPLNPLRLGLAVVIIGIAFVVTTYHAFGRRDLLSVMTACLWGAYHGHFKYLSARRAAVPLAALGLGIVVVVAAFTATRSHDNTQISQGEMNSRMMNADIKAGVLDLLSGQFAAALSMRVVETRPDPFSYDTLHTLRYTLTSIIPRDWYEGKPVALGLSMVPQTGLDANRDEGFTVGAGLVGHIWNDNPWLALPLYAILMGVILHVLDKVLKLQPGNPFVVIAIGGTLGDLIAISRGEMGLYIFRTLTGVLVVYIALQVMARFMIRSGWHYVPQEDEPAVETHNPAAEYGEVA